MKRFHVHIGVQDLAASIRFYSTLFGMPPAVEKTDYAKWMLDDPRVNFAISQRGLRPGIDHLGLQVESEEDLTVQRAQVEQAELSVLEQSNASCCYARSDKYWVTDPQGVAWETFRTLDSIPVYGDTVRAPMRSAEPCCDPAPAIALQPAKAGNCCP
jgi:catechol 2,3-dioxygenase-like lactoylglutathione lyase family enzyme